MISKSTRSARLHAIFFTLVVTSAVPSQAQDSPAIPFTQAHEPVVDGTALTLAEAELDHLGLHGFVRLAQGLAVLYAHQVADHAPAEAEPVGHALQWLDEAFPGRIDRSLQRLEIAAQVFEQGA